MDVRWIWDGEMFASSRAKPTSDYSGVRRFLKPLAFDLATHLGGWVHWRGLLWKHWKHNVWYARDDGNAEVLLSRFNSHLNLLTAPAPDSGDIVF